MARARPLRAGELGRGLGSLHVEDVVATAAAEAEPAEFGDGFEQRRLARAVLTHEERQRPVQIEIEPPDKGEVVGIVVLSGDALRDAKVLGLATERLGMGCAGCRCPGGRAPWYRDVTSVA